jgi:hypothetical protein
MDLKSHKHPRYLKDKYFKEGQRYNNLIILNFYELYTHRQKALFIVYEKWK